MLYKTHQKYGTLSGLIGIPIAVTTGLLPVVTLGMRFSDAILTITLVTIAMISASFGAEFPDCDSYGGRMKNGEMKKGSIPSQKHPFISKMFRAFGVKHRGKFSHDYASLALFFGICLFISTWFTKLLVHKVANGSSLFATISQLLIIYIAYLVSADIVNKYKFKIRKGKLGLLEGLAFTGILFVSLVVLIMMGGFINPLLIASTTVGMKSSILLTAIVKVFVIFTWIGAYSHLFADMMTNEGVNIFGKRLAPAKLVLKIKKLPLIGKWLLQTDLKTGSAYEDMCNLIVTILCVPAIVLAFIAITGGDVIQFLHVIGILNN